MRIMHKTGIFVNDMIIKNDEVKSLCGDLLLH